MLFRWINSISLTHRRFGDAGLAPGRDQYHRIARDQDLGAGRLDNGAALTITQLQQYFDGVLPGRAAFDCVSGHCASHSSQHADDDAFAAPTHTGARNTADLMRIVLAG